MQIFSSLKASPYKGLEKEVRKAIHDGFTQNVALQCLGEMQHGEDEQESIDHYSKAVSGEAKKEFLAFFKSKGFGDK